ncbi:hypothetical protein F5148DRAFT_1367002 [Russula earlei]|uniref:Uncharacterized protein n=1 Tax=Russula earlei TaxID=71964 RepID=A0ACC0UF88_9AGAM|nr:hypothetical protein F5148DRAFT_1367002 [Russula earlei]
MFLSNPAPSWGMGEGSRWQEKGRGPPSNCIYEEMGKSGGKQGPSGVNIWPRLTFCSETLSTYASAVPFYSVDEQLTFLNGLVYWYLFSSPALFGRVRCANGILAYSRNYGKLSPKFAVNGMEPSEFSHHDVTATATNPFPFPHSLIITGNNDMQRFTYLEPRKCSSVKREGSPPREDQGLPEHSPSTLVIDRDLEADPDFVNFLLLRHDLTAARSEVDTAFFAVTQWCRLPLNSDRPASNASTPEALVQVQSSTDRVYASQDHC